MSGVILVDFKHLPMPKNRRLVHPCRNLNQLKYLYNTVTNILISSFKQTLLGFLKPWTKERVKLVLHHTKILYQIPFKTCTAKACYI